jgi:hypothetical protein
MTTLHADVKNGGTTRKSVNRSQMDIKRKTCDIRKWKKTFISRLILHQHWHTSPSLYKCVETRSVEVFWLLSQPWFVHSNNPVKLTFSFIYILWEISQGQDRPIRLIFSRFFSSLDTHHAHSFGNFKRSRVILYAKPCVTPQGSCYTIVILLSARINSSNQCTVASVEISTGRPGHASSATFERPWENLSTQLWTALRDKHLPP